MTRWCGPRLDVLPSLQVWQMLQPLGTGHMLARWLVDVGDHAHARTSAAGHQVVRVRDNCSRGRPVVHQDWPCAVVCKGKHLIKQNPVTATQRLHRSWGVPTQENVCTQEKKIFKRGWPPGRVGLMTRYYSLASSRKSFKDSSVTSYEVPAVCTLS